MRWRRECAGAAAAAGTEMALQSAGEEGDDGRGDGNGAAWRRDGMATRRRRTRRGRRDREMARGDMVRAGEARNGDGMVRRRALERRWDAKAMGLSRATRRWTAHRRRGLGSGVARGEARARRLQGRIGRARAMGSDSGGATRATAIDGLRAEGQGRRRAG